jgi:hypothetical protein
MLTTTYLPGCPAFSYCGDHLDSSGIIYIQGRNGALANMDVDCDGANGGGGGGAAVAADDGRCRPSTANSDTQGTTAFRDAVAGYNRNITDLNPYVHPYVVFGNAAGTRRRRGWRAFDPTAYGVRPLSAVAVVCPGYRLYFGVWGDTNGDDGPKPMVGEASLALATFCGGQGVSGTNGIDGNDVLYIAFRGADAVPGPDGADWAATDPATFESSIEPLGMRLVARVQPGGDASDAPSRVLSTGKRKIAVVVITLSAMWFCS